MQVEKKVDGLIACQCGHTPDTVNIGYGRTPYSVYCEGCGKGTNIYRQIGGAISNAVEFWNTIAPLIECRVPSGLLYKYMGREYIYGEVRNAILDNWSSEPVYILFSNGKIEADKNNWLTKND